jgi:hypothetical protein
MRDAGVPRRRRQQPTIVCRSETPRTGRRLLSGRTINEGKQAPGGMRLSCHHFRANEVRLPLSRRNRTDCSVEDRKFGLGRRLA